MSNLQVPVVIGVGDIKNASLKLEDAVEPLHLMLQAIESALQDTTLSAEATSSLKSVVDSISVVANWTWPYPNTPELIASRLGCQATHTAESEHGGNSPAKLFDEAARRIALGQSKVAVVTGGEALASLAALKAAKKFPPSNWTHLEDTTSILERPRAEDLGSKHGLGAPTQVYALYEAGFRSYRGQKLSDNHQESSQLYAEFSQAAASNPNAWRYGAPADGAEVIGTVTKRNRMICSPYPLLMNAFNTVNLAAACLLTSAAFAKEIGIPESRWVYAVGGAGTADHDQFWNRPNFHSSRSLSQSLDTALAASKLGKEEIDLFDFYSCFPIVPKLASEHLGLPITGGSKPTTLLGGLTSFGGAGNNYSMHAITEMTRQLRQGKGNHGLVMANGGVLSYHHTICLSRHPRKDASAYPVENTLPAHLPDEHPVVAERVQGRATIDTYTVQYARDGSPQVAFILGRLTENGHRFIANATDKATLKELSSGVNEQIGKPGWVDCDAKSGRNSFTLQGASL